MKNDLRPHEGKADPETVPGLAPPPPSHDPIENSVLTCAMIQALFLQVKYRFATLPCIK
jgi:hypothetical protein